MPTYRYVCSEGHSLERECSIKEMETFEALLNICPQCGQLLGRDFSIGRPIVFHAGFYEHISETGQHISSMGELKKVARDNGNYSQYAEDMGSAFLAKEGRWI